jgi:nicotinamidase-related amidase
MSTPPKVHPKTTLVLLLDFQTVHMAQVPASFSILSNTAALITVARKTGIKIAHIRMAFTESESTSLPTSNKIFSALATNPAYRQKYIDTEPTSQFDPAVSPREDLGDIVQRKTRVGPFLHSPGTPDLDTKLRALGIENLIIAGVATGGAVLATVVQAADLDYRIFVVEDSCGDFDQDLHDTLVEKIFKKRGWVVKSGEVEGLIEG